MDSGFMKVKVTGNSMWPTLVDGEIAKFGKEEELDYFTGQIILAKHPLKSELLMIKRIHSINEEGIFLVGDNPDPTASEDSHNFGRISENEIIGKYVNN